MEDPTFILGATTSDVDILCQNLQRAASEEEQLQIVVKIRQLLSRPINPLLDDVVTAGFVPLAVSILNTTYNSSIIFEATWALTNIASGTSYHTQAIVDADGVPVLLRLVVSDNVLVMEQALWAIGNIAGDGPATRDMLIALGAMETLLAIINTEGISQVMLKNCTWGIANLCRGKNPAPAYAKVAPALPVMCRLLYLDDHEILADACWCVSYLSDGGEAKVQALLDSNVVPRVAELLQVDNSMVQTPAIRTLGNIITGTDSQTQAVIDLGILPYFHTLLGHASATIVKETCWALSNVCAGSQPQIQSVIDTNLIPVLIRITEKGDFKSRKEAAWAISNVAVSGSPAQASYVASLGCVIPLVNMLKFLDARVPLYVLDGLYALLVLGASTDGAVNYIKEQFDEAGGEGIVEKLLESENPTILKKAYKILDTFFGNEDEELDLSHENFTFEAPMIPEQGYNL